MIEEAKEDAAPELARESVLEAVAEAEGIEVSDEDLLEALEPTAEREGTEPAKLLERLKETGRDVPVRRELRLRRAVEAIADTREADRAGQGEGARAALDPGEAAQGGGVLAAVDAGLRRPSGPELADSHVAGAGSSLLPGKLAA